MVLEREHALVQEVGSEAARLAQALAQQEREDAEFRAAREAEQRAFEERERAKVRAAAEEERRREQQRLDAERARERREAEIAREATLDAAARLGAQAEREKEAAAREAKADAGSSVFLWTLIVLGISSIFFFGWLAQERTQVHAMEPMQPPATNVVVVDPSAAP